LTYKFTKRIHVLSVLGLLLTLFFCLLSINSPQLIETSESLLLDYRFLLRNLLAPPPQPDNIVIIEIDERSLEKYGRWPWSREIQGQLIDKILDCSPSVLAIDIFYSEVESEENDRKLGKVFAANSEKIVLAGAFDFEKENDRLPPDFLLDSAILKVRDYSTLGNVLRVTNFKKNVENVYLGGVIGHVFSPPDLDGKLRWEHLYISYQDDFYPSIALATAAKAMNVPLEDITIYGSYGVGIGDTLVPTDPSGRIRINYLGGEDVFLHLSAADILSGKADPSILSGKIAILGTTAISTYDFMVTPFLSRAPAVEKNATVIENLLHSRLITAVPLSILIFIIIATGTSLSLVLPKLRAAGGIIFSISTILLFAVLNVYLFSFEGKYLNFFYPFSNMILITLSFGGYKYFTEEKKAKDLKKMFASYVSPKIVEQLTKNPEMANLGGSRKEVTVLFSDLQGFTTFSENRDPEEVVSMLNEYFKVMSDIIFHWDGTLDKFVGDEIMAFWGAPTEQPNHAELALRCALDMSDQLDRLREKWKAEGKAQMDCGIGLNTGIALIGNIGSPDKMMDYTAIGDTINLGARVEAMTRKYETRILITEFTQSKISGIFDGKDDEHITVKEEDTVKVKGKAQPVTIYSITSSPTINETYSKTE